MNMLLLVVVTIGSIFIPLVNRPWYVGVEGYGGISSARWLGFHLELLGNFALLGYVCLHCSFLAEFTDANCVVGQVHVGGH